MFPPYGVQFSIQNSTRRRSAKIYQNVIVIVIVIAYFDPIINCLMIKINNFRSDLSNVSATTATLVAVQAACSRAQDHILILHSTVPYLAWKRSWKPPFLKRSAVIR